MDSGLALTRPGMTGSGEDDAWPDAQEENYLSFIGGATFSAGAGGSAGLAPSFCAS